MHASAVREVMAALSKHRDTQLELMEERERSAALQQRLDELKPSS
jgi:hypothetical protein